MFTKAWKVYGLDGHKQRESFSPSYTYDFLPLMIRELSLSRTAIKQGLTCTL